VGEREKLFLEGSKKEVSTPAAEAWSDEDTINLPIEKLRTLAKAGNPFAHRQLAKRYEHGDGIDVSVERALFHHAVEARLFAEAGDEDEAQVARALRGAAARALPPEAAVRIAYEAMDWRPVRAHDQ
jgi:hypothetical protein